MRELGRYINRLDPDAAALQTYGQAILRIRNADGRHLKSAMAALRRSAAMQPDGEEVRRELLDLYLQTRYRTETRELADWFIDRHTERGVRRRRSRSWPRPRPSAP